MNPQKHYLAVRETKNNLAWTCWEEHGSSSPSTISESCRKSVLWETLIGNLISRVHQLGVSLCVLSSPPVSPQHCLSCSFSVDAEIKSAAHQLISSITNRNAGYLTTGKSIWNTFCGVSKHGLCLADSHRLRRCREVNKKKSMEHCTVLKC